MKTNPQGNDSFGLLLSSIFRSFRSLTAPGAGWIFIKSILITIFSLVLFIIIITYAAGHLAPQIHNHFLATYLPWLAGIGSSILAWILFPGIMPFITGFFSNEIIAIIEEHDYSEMTVNPNSFLSDLGFDLRFAIKAVLLNIVALPLYLIPVVNVIIFYSLNGYLLGKQFYLAAARRHLKNAGVPGRKYGRAIFWGGVLISFLATIPVINLIVPFWGVALMTHMFHISNRQDASSGLSS
jgi:uncharacterized protein involved in cysteine biosynthesis